MELLKEIKTLLSEIGEEGGNCFVHSFTFMLLHHILPSCHPPPAAGTAAEQGVG